MEKLIGFSVNRSLNFTNQTINQKIEKKFEPNHKGKKLYQINRIGLVQLDFWLKSITAHPNL